MSGQAPVRMCVRDALVVRADATDTFRLYCHHFDVTAGARLAIAAPSGSGKTTLLEMLGLLLKPDRIGTFTFTGAGGAVTDLMPIATASSRASYADRMSGLRADSIAIVPQRGGLLPFVSARRNILIHPALAHRDPQHVARDLAGLADALDIRAHLDKRPAQLSVGQQQRIALARGLIARPALILADEPTAALEPARKLETMRLIGETAGAASVIVATHDTATAAEAGFQIVEGRQGIAPDGGEATCFDHGLIRAGAAA